MRLPKYQWLQEQPTSSCGYCDKIYVPYTDQYSASGLKFQIILDTVSTTVIDLATNPFDEITSTDLTFKLTFPAEEQLQFYIGGNVYIFSWALQTEQYTYTQDGNVYKIKVSLDAGSSLISSTNMAFAISEIIDVNHGTTVSLDLITLVITLSDVPTGSYLNNAFGYINTVNTITSSDFIGEFFYWNGSTLCYYIGIDTVLNPLLSFDTTIYLGYNILTFNVNAIQSGYTITGTADNGVDTPQTFTVNPTVGNSEVTFNVIGDITTENYTITIELTELNENVDGLCVSDIVINNIELLDSPDIEDCDNNITPLFCEISYYNNYALVETTEVLPNPFRIILTTQAPYEETLTTRWYHTTTGTDCNEGELIHLQWTSDCNFAELEYEQMPFTNDVYLTGVLIKQANELLDSVDNVTSSGRKVLVYKNTQSSYELRLHPFLADTMESIIERIFDHKTVLINGIEHNTTDVFQVSEIDLGIYTGRVDLYKSGTEVISSSCCC